MPRRRGRRGCRLNVGNTPVEPRHEGCRAAWVEARERWGLAMQRVRADGMSFFSALAETLAWRGVARRSAGELRKEMANYMRGEVAGVPLDQAALGDWAVGAAPSTEWGRQLIQAAERMFHVNLVVVCLQGQRWSLARAREPQGGKTDVWLVHSSSGGQGQYDPAFIVPTEWKCHLCEVVVQQRTELVTHFEGRHLAEADEVDKAHFLERTGTFLCGKCGCRALVNEGKALAGDHKHCAARQRAPAAECNAAPRGRRRGTRRVKAYEGDFPTVAQIAALGVPTVSDVPATYRVKVAHCMAEILDSVAHDPEFGGTSRFEDSGAGAWTDLYLFVATVLKAKQKVRAGRRQKRLNDWEDDQMQKRLEWWEQGQWRLLWAGAKRTAKLAARRRRRPTLVRDRLRLALKRLRQRCDGAAMKILQSAEVVEGPEATEKIRKKYPGPNAEDEERGQVAMRPPWELQENGQAMRAGREHWTEPVTHAHMMQALRVAMKKKRCKSPGRSGMRYEHLTAPLKLNVEDDTEKAILERYIRGLTAVVRALLLGRVPVGVMTLLRKGRATCLRKRDNGVRPIVAVEVLVKLAGATAIKCLRSEQQQDAYEQLVGSVQMGAGRKGGAEAVVHAAQQCYEDAATHNRDVQVGGLKHGMLLLDGDNAFGEINREIAFDILAARCPYLYPLVRAMYGQDNAIQVGSDTLPVTRGVLQGDSVAPVIFAAVLWHTWQQLDEELRRGVRPMFYADDMTIAGDVDQLRQVYTQLRERGPQNGLLIKGSKLVLVVPNCRHTPEWVAEARGSALHDGAMVLGSPIGTEQYALGKAAEKAVELQAAFNAIATLGHSVGELRLMRTVMPYKVNHILRCSKPVLAMQFADALDGAFETALKRTLHIDSIPFESGVILQARRAKGGWGIPKAVSTLYGAYIGSRTLTGALVKELLGRVLPLPADCEEYMDSFQERTGQQISVPVDDQVFHVQKRINHAEEKARWASVKTDMYTDAVRQTRLINHVSSLEADPYGCTAFLDDIDGFTERYRGQHQAPNEHVLFRVAACRQLAIPLVSDGVACANWSRGDGCLRPMDTLGDHAGTCPKEAGWRTRRHNEVRDVLYQLAVEAGHTPGQNIGKEKPERMSSLRPADIWATTARMTQEERDKYDSDGDVLMRDGSGAARGGRGTPGRDTDFIETAYDVTITETQQRKSLQPNANVKAGTMAHDAYEAKLRKYRLLFEKLRDLGVRNRRFQPLAFESSGYVHPIARQRIKDWEAEAKLRLGPERFAFTGSSTRRKISTIIHFWGAVALCGALRPQDWLGERGLQP